jgi:hypothetical protein
MRKKKLNAVGKRNTLGSTETCLPSSHQGRTKTQLRQPCCYRLGMIPYMCIYVTSNHFNLYWFGSYYGPTLLKSLDQPESFDRI